MWLCELSETDPEIISFHWLCLPDAARQNEDFYRLTERYRVFVERCHDHDIPTTTVMDGASRLSDGRFQPHLPPHRVIDR